MDRKLKKVNCRINFHIDVLSFELTGNKQDINGNQKLVSIGFENQAFQVSNTILQFYFFNLFILHSISSLNKTR